MCVYVCIYIYIYILIIICICHFPNIVYLCCFYVMLIALFSIDKTLRNLWPIKQHHQANCAWSGSMVTGVTNAVITSTTMYPEKLYILLLVLVLCTMLLQRSKDFSVDKVMIRGQSDDILWLVIYMYIIISTS